MSISSQIKVNRLESQITKSFLDQRVTMAAKFGVSEGLFFKANLAILQLYHDENKLIFNEMTMRSALYYTNTLSWSKHQHA